MSKLYVWTEGSWTKGVVASAEAIISFKYLTEHSHTGIIVSDKVNVSEEHKALITGSSEPKNNFHKFLLTLPEKGLWKCYKDNNWINHE